MDNLCPRWRLTDIAKLATVAGMNEEMRSDLERLERLAFRRVKACGELIKRYHRLPARTRCDPGFTMMERVRGWLLSPFTLWPVDFCGVADHLLSQLEAGQRVDRDMELLISLLSDAPGRKEQEAITAHEHDVEKGRYESLIKARLKFTQREQELFDHPDFQAGWKGLKERFDLEKYRDRKGIIRRTMTQERSFHSKEWRFQWGRRKDKFRVVFDAFCHRWILYGMEGERPLLQKFSVNVTAFGTMIFIPRYWSFDGRRDLKWGAVNSLHRTRGVHRQGEKLGRNRLERSKEAKAVKQLWRAAGAAGCKGDARYEFVNKRMGWREGTDSSRIKRLLKA